MEKACCNFIIFFSFLFFGLSSCETEDILPNIQLSVDSDNLSEDNGLVTLTATLNDSLNKQTSIAILVGTAQTSIDYNLSSENFLFEKEVIHHQLKLHLCKTTKLKALKV